MAQIVKLQPTPVDHWSNTKIKILLLNLYYDFEANTWSDIIRASSKAMEGQFDFQSAAKQAVPLAKRSPLPIWNQPFTKSLNSAIFADIPEADLAYYFYYLRVIYIVIHVLRIHMYKGYKHCRVGQRELKLTRPTPGQIKVKKQIGIKKNFFQLENWICSFFQINATFLTKSLQLIHSSICNNKA